MNERIRAIAIQCHHRYSEHQIDLEKFAELIVRECAWFMETNTKVNDDGAVVDAPEAWEMLNHFGVE
jgi:hypothetical protein